MRKILCALLGLYILFIFCEQIGCVPTLYVSDPAKIAQARDDAATFYRRASFAYKKHEITEDEETKLLLRGMYFDNLIKMLEEMKKYPEFSSISQIDLNEDEFSAMERKIHDAVQSYAPANGN